MAIDLPKKVTLWTLESKSEDAEYFGKEGIGGTSTLESLRFFWNQMIPWSSHLLCRTLKTNSE